MERWLVARDLSGKPELGEGIKGSWSRFISTPALSGLISQCAERLGSPVTLVLRGKAFGKGRGKSSASARTTPGQNLNERARNRRH